MHFEELLQITLSALLSLQVILGPTFLGKWHTSHHYYEEDNYILIFSSRQEVSFIFYLKNLFILQFVIKLQNIAT